MSGELPAATCVSLDYTRCNISRHRIEDPIL
jgi:hypothetical protein